MDALRKSGDSCGARITVVASGVPVGWGEPVYDKLDADIAHAMMGINAVKGVEIGAGFASVAQTGTEHSDEMTPQGFLSNNAGGILGGISTGQDIVVSIAVKPTSSIRLDRRSIDKAGSAGDRQHARPPRSLRRHSRDADRRGDAGAGADGPRAAPSRAERRRRLPDAEDRGGAPARRGRQARSAPARSTIRIRTKPERRGAALQPASRARDLAPASPRAKRSVSVSPIASLRGILHDRARARR